LFRKACRKPWRSRAAICGCFRCEPSEAAARTTGRCPVRYRSVSVIFALSFKRSISFDDRTATSELAFVCNQEEKYVAVLLIPLDGTFKNRQNLIPVVIQKVEEQSDASDLMQRWENGSDYIFLESPDEQEELASYLKDREAEGVKSAH